MATILVVDDHPINRSFLCTLLGYKGHRLLEATDGQEALELVRSDSPDLVIADVLMPVMDGYEFVRQLRGDPALAQTNVIFYTAHYVENEARALAKACGVSHILVKPSEPETVLRTVDAALSLNPARQDAAALTPEAFDRSHLRLLTDKLSEKAANLRKVNLRLGALVELGMRFSSERDPRLLLDGFCSAAREILGATYSAVGVMERDTNRLRHFIIHGVEAKGLSEVAPASPSQGILKKLLTGEAFVRLRGLATDPQALDLPPCNVPKTSFLAVPIVSPSRVYGWLCLTDKIGVDEFDEEDERLAGILAAQVGRIYENGSLYAEVQRRTTALEQEVAERKQAEEALRESEERYRLLFDANPYPMWVHSVETLRFLAVNEAAVEHYGYTREEFYSMTIRKLHPPDQVTALSDESLGLPAEPDVSRQSRHCKKSGVVIDVEISSHRIVLGGQPAELVLAHDITDRKLLEEQFRQAQKMDAIGRLAGGVAHDFNNVLTAIIGFSDLLMLEAGHDPKLRGSIEEIRKAGKRAATLTSQLLAFSRRQVLQPKVLNLNGVVTDISKMLRRMIGENIELETVTQPDLGQVKADPGQIEQILANLAVNARDAMPDGGKLTIETSNVSLDEDYARFHAEVAPGDYVVMSVTDTGHGMDLNVLSRIFEPFFTTKEVGKGTGLGLSTVYGIVKQSGGHIQVNSQAKQGTTFKIYFPRTGQKIEFIDPTASFLEPQRGVETILLVEDEEAVRNLARTILGIGGYTVLPAAGGAEALEIVGSHKGPIHLMLTDIMMPHMSGRVLAERVGFLKPDMKVLFMSGYTTDAVIHDGVSDSEVGFLQKPFSPVELAKKIRETLDSKH